MPSVAFTVWRAERQDRIQQLLDAHSRVGGTASGRRWRTEQLNWALILRVAAEFQGFSRSLHDEAVDFFALQAAPLNAPLEKVLRTELTRNRSLDRGNAQPGSLGNDFSRFGIQLWPRLQAQSTRAKQWNETLEIMNQARNAIAHADESQIAALAGDGWKLSHLETIRRFQRTADSTAEAMDTVIGRHLALLFGGSAPW